MTHKVIQLIAMPVNIEWVSLQYCSVKKSCWFEEAEGARGNKIMLIRTILG